MNKLIILSRYTSLLLTLLISFACQANPAQQDNSIITRQDRYTGEVFSYTEIKTDNDGKRMTDAKTDNVLLVKIDNKYYKRNFTGPINVKWFGARGDGKNDDTKALQDAINNGSGRSIFIPTGNYGITQSLHIINGMELVGEGDVGSVGGSSIFPLGKDLSYAIFTSNSGVIEDVIFRNIRTLKAKHSLSLDVKNGYLTKVKWYNCVFQEHDIAINIYGSDVNGMYANTFSDCYFKSSRMGIYCQGPYNINIIQNSGFENMGEGYIKLGSTSSPSLSNSFIGNRCESVVKSNGTAIELGKSVFGFYINRNFFENTFTTLLKTNGAKNVDFSNNTNTNSDPGKFGKITINGGECSIKNNISLTGMILDISDNGFCSELSSNSFLNYTPNVKQQNLGTVNNSYNKQFNQ